MTYFRAAAVLIFLLCFSAISFAQVDLITTPLDKTGFPIIKTQVKVQCDFLLQDNLNVSNFTVTEDGLRVDSLTLTCLPNLTRQAISLAMVGDRRNIMPAWGVTTMKSAYKGFVSAFKTWSGVPDKGSVYADPSPALSMTSDKAALTNAINGLDPTGSLSLTVITNAINDLLANAGSGQKNVVLTISVDQPITPSIPEILALNAAYNNAKNAGTKFHVILIYTNPLIPFLNDVIVQLLKSFAINTGGLYFLCGNEQEMRRGYRELTEFLFTEILPCTLSYKSKVPCTDGSTRTTIITFTGCTGSDSDTLQYVAPGNVNGLSGVLVQLSSSTVNATEQTQLTVTMTSTLANSVLFPFSITVLFDNTLLTLSGVATNGFLAEGFTPTITPIAGGARIDFDGPPKIISGSGALCQLTFTAGDPASDVTTPVNLQSVLFTKGCLRTTQTQNGNVTIIARRPILNLTCDIPTEVRWDSTIFSYNLDTFVASVDVGNTGNRDATNVQATIILPPGLELVSGSPTVALNPTILASGNNGYANWTVRAKERLTSDSLTVCFRITSDNHLPIECCKKIFVQERGPKLELLCTADVIMVMNNSYSPMPFTVRAEVTNIGAQIAQPLKATITVPSPLALVPGEQATKFVLPKALRNGQKGNISWQLTHPPMTTQTMYDVVICVESPNTEMICCMLQVKIPALRAPSLQTLCDVPDSLIFNQSKDEYEPNPFTVSVSTKNVSGLDAENVRAIIILPPECTLSPSSQKDTIAFNPSTLSNNPSNPPSIASWQVRASKQSIQKSVVIRFKIIGDNFTEVECEKAIKLPKAGSSSFSCNVIAPDSLTVGVDSSDYTPNPFLVTCTVRNTGTLTSGNLIATLNLPAGLQSQSPLSQPIGAGVLTSGEQKQITWTVSADPSSTPTTRAISINIFEEGNQVSSCADMIFIPKLNQTIRALCISPDTIKYDRTTGTYSPDPFVFNIKVTNIGAVDAQNIDATIQLPPELQLVSGPATLRIAASLAPSQSSQTGWSLRVIPQSGLTSVIVTVRLTVNGLPSIQCTKTIILEGESLASLWCSVSLPSKISFIYESYSPNPFDVTVTVRNTGLSPVSSISALLVTPPDMSIDNSDVALKLITPSTLAPGDSTTVTFKVRVYPHPVSRLDTIRVSLITSQAPPIICFRTVQVDKALRPRFDIQCSMIDTIRYDAVTRKLIPDPAQMNVSVKNIGDATAKNVYGVISLSRGLFVNDVVQKSVIPGTLAPNQSGSVSWSISPIKNITAHTDSIYVAIRTDDFGIVESKCVKIIFVEAVTAPLFSLTCTAPDSISLLNGIYAPTQIVASVLVKNTGNTSGNQTTARIIIPPDFKLATGETITKQVGSGTLAPNQSQLVQWTLDVTPRGYEDRPNICFVVTAANADSANCCHQIFIPGKKRPSLSFLCDAPKQIPLDTLNGVYLLSPFNFVVNVSNTGSDPIDSVNAEIFLPPGLDLFGGSSTRALTTTLQPNQTVLGTFTILVRPRAQGDTLTIFVRVFSPMIADQYCAHKVFVPGISNNALFTLLCPTKIDTISYTPQTNTAQPPSLQIGSVITNLKNKTITLAVAEIFLPPGLTLENGDAPTRIISNVLPGNQNSRAFEWNVTAARPQRDTIVKLLLRVTADGSSVTMCERFVQILIRTDVPHLFINSDEVVIAGESVDIPIWIDARGVALRNASITLKYDATLLALERIVLFDDMLGRWQTPRWTEQAGTVQINLQSIGDFILSGKLMYVRFKAYEFPEKKQFEIKTTLLDVYQGLFNDGNLRATTTNKSLFITGRCARPLNASGKYQLSPTIPNPANPTAQIEYEIPFDMNVRLTLHDIYGRVIMTAVDQFETKGVHSIVIDVSRFTSGMYFYRLESSVGVLIGKMVVTK